MTTAPPNKSGRSCNESEGISDERREKRRRRSALDGRRRRRRKEDAVCG